MTVADLLLAPTNGFFLFRAKAPDGGDRLLCRESFRDEAERAKLIAADPAILDREVTEQFVAEEAV